MGETLRGNDRREPEIGMWEQDETGRVKTPFEPLILAATLAMIPVLIIERDVTSGAWRTLADIANWAIWGVFAVEITAVLVVARRRLAAVKAHWLDTAITLVTFPLFGRLFSQLRLLRLLRAFVVLGRSLLAERRLTSTNTFRFAAVSTVFIVFIAGAAVESVNHGEFKSTWDGMWWAVVTVTTVGYGDLAPTTVGGRLIAMALMLVGIGFISVLTATIASLFVKTDRADEHAGIAAALARIEADLADLKDRLGPEA